MYVANTAPSAATSQVAIPFDQVTATPATQASGVDHLMLVDAYCGTPTHRDFRRLCQRLLGALVCIHAGDTASQTANPEAALNDYLMRLPLGRDRAENADAAHSRASIFRPEPVYRSKTCLDHPLGKRLSPPVDEASTSSLAPPLTKLRPDERLYPSDLIPALAKLYENRDSDTSRHETVRMAHALLAKLGVISEADKLEEAEDFLRRARDAATLPEHLGLARTADQYALSAARLSAWQVNDRDDQTGYMLELADEATNRRDMDWLTHWPKFQQLGLQTLPDLPILVMHSLNNYRTNVVGAADYNIQDAIERTSYRPGNPQGVFDPKIAPLLTKMAKDALGIDFASQPGEWTAERTEEMTTALRVRLDELNDFLGYPPGRMRYHPIAAVSGRSPMEEVVSRWYHSNIDAHALPWNAHCSEQGAEAFRELLTALYEKVATKQSGGLILHGVARLWTAYVPSDLKAVVPPMLSKLLREHDLRKAVFGIVDKSGEDVWNKPMAVYNRIYDANIAYDANAGMYDKQLDTLVELGYECFCMKKAMETGPGKSQFKVRYDKQGKAPVSVQNNETGTPVVHMPKFAARVFYDHRGEAERMEYMAFFEHVAKTEFLPYLLAWPPLAITLARLGGSATPSTRVSKEDGDAQAGVDANMLTRDRLETVLRENGHGNLLSNWLH
ncbi:hypothetical protein [Bordetella sp. LUAb4]|uniref:hypothetical protein n=1 Tax=Bordetella sp. LUAb4 TaxID=2843195 RepID=UPI001E3B4D87|nr:hypothetical protein [Bordetella sp. LUAb4]